MSTAVHTPFLWMIAPLQKRVNTIKEGKYYDTNVLQSLIHATPENHRMLERLFGVEFEKPPIKLTSKEIVQAMFNKGHKYVLCWVSIDTEQPDNTSVWAFIKEINDDGWFVDQNNLDWQYVTPFNQTTGEAITELPT